MAKTLEVSSNEETLFQKIVKGSTTGYAFGEAVAGTVGHFYPLSSVEKGLIKGVSTVGGVMYEAGGVIGEAIYDGVKRMCGGGEKAARKLAIQQEISLLVSQPREGFAELRRIEEEIKRKKQRC